MKHEKESIGWVGTMAVTQVLCGIFYSVLRPHSVLDLFIFRDILLQLLKG